LGQLFYTSDPKSEERGSEMNRIIAKLLNKSGQSSRSEQPRRSSYIVTRAELAPCTCPDFCERDHEND